MSFLEDVLAANREELAEITAKLDRHQRVKLLELLKSEVNDPWRRFQSDPIGFVEEGLNETLWSKQKEILLSVRDNKRTAVVACHAPGKLLEPSSKIITPSGVQLAGELKIGDLVFDESGKPTRIIAVSPIHTRPSYKITFHDGTEIRCAQEHEWAVHDAATRHRLRAKYDLRGEPIKDWREHWDSTIVVETRELAKKVNVVNGKKLQSRNWSIPTSQPLQFPHADLPVDPYTLGVWLGDGTTARRTLTLNLDDAHHITEKMRNNGTQIGSIRVIEAKGSTLVGLPKCPLPLGNKHIPEAYHQASAEQRLELLRGLMDTDGWHDKKTVNSATITLSRKELFDDVVRLIQSFGWIVSTTSKIPKIGKKKYGRCWSAYFSPNIPVFTLARYPELGTTRQQVRATARFITNVEEDGVIEGFCIEVDSPRNLYLAALAMIPTHNSHIAARVAGWWVSSHPPGTARVVSTAPSWAQVRGILWGQIRRMAKRHKLPGEVLMTEWKIGTELVGEGFSPRDNDETRVQGIHAPHLLVIVDEAGGLSKVLGYALEALMTGGHTRMLVLGNPPTDTEDGWFEKICGSDLYNVIEIPAAATPNFTGEDAGICKACPVEVAEHGVAEHLVDQEWVNDVITEFGEDSSFVKARVHAQFPKAGANKVIPFSWCEDASTNEFPMEGKHVRLGVDVASDGGDEFVIAQFKGWTGKIVHKSSGESNTNAVDVCGVIWNEIEAAIALHALDEIMVPVRVKIDAIGVGWGVVGLLEKWVIERKVERLVKIVGVNVAESAGDTEKFANQRAEMWWNGRTLLQPREEGGQIRLDVERKALAQLSTPMYKSTSAGQIAIEKKADMKRRNAQSPDHAEALLLALYEPPGTKEAPSVAPVSVPQSNVWREV